MRVAILTAGVAMAMAMAMSVSGVRAAAGEGSWARYVLLSAVEHKAPPVSEIVLTVGPREGRNQWWQLEGKKTSGVTYTVRLLTERVPMVEGDAPGTITRYILRESDDQPLEYLDLRTGGPLLPKFNFVTDLLPTAVRPAESTNGFAEAGSYLGHVVALTESGTNHTWTDWPAATSINLNPDEIQYVYGLARDTEGHYLKKGDYTYVPLTREEVDQLIDLGVNSFDVDDKTEEWAYRRPVFYYKKFGLDTKPKYPELLYRSNFRGAVAFIDEPDVHILSDRGDLDRLTRPEQGGLLLTKRVEGIWNRPAPGEWRRGLLREQLVANGVNLGNLALDDNDHPIWITMPETAFYQLQGGTAGVVHEGRYRLDKYTAFCERYLGGGLDLTAREMLMMNYAFLRGAARAFGRSWGMSIYGQCDPEIAPEAMTLAYDMGARYIWLWTYDHQHHLPHFMKLKLLEHLREHKIKHPRGPLDKLLNAPRTVIVFPYGYAYYIEFENLWDAKNLHLSFSNDAGVPYREVVAAALAEGIACAKAGEDFDFAVDIGQDFKGYNRVVRIGKDGKVTDSRAVRHTIKLKALDTRTARPEPLSAKPTLVIPAGTAASWDDGHCTTLDRAEQVVSFVPSGSKDKPWGGPQDLSAKVSFARDERFLYLAAGVTDDKHVQENTGGEMWRGDSLELALDLMLDKPGKPLGYAEVLIGLAADGPQVYLVRSAEGRNGGPVRNAKVTITPDTQGDLNYEVTIPWRELTDAPPELIDHCAVRFRVNDNDGSGRKCALELGSREKTPGVNDGFALCRLEPLASAKSDSAFVRQERSILPEDRRWELIVDAVRPAAADAELEITLERGGRAAGAGAFALNLPAGRSQSCVVVDTKGLGRGVYRCRARLRSGQNTLTQNNFQIYLLR